MKTAGLGWIQLIVYRNKAKNNLSNLIYVRK